MNRDFFRYSCNQGCHIWVGSKFPDISLTIPWHIAIFPWQFILFFQVKNKDYPQKQFKKTYIDVKCFCHKEINIKNSTYRSNKYFEKGIMGMYAESSKDN